MAFPSPSDTIWNAVRRGDLEAVRGFVQRGNVPDVEDDYDQQSLLTVACEAGHIDVVRYLYERGCRSTYRYGYAPEAFAAMRGGHLEVLRFLCKVGLDPLAQEYTKHDDPLIFRAIEQRRVEVVRLLLAHGGWISSEHEDEATEEEWRSDKPPSPIELAARAGDIEFVTFLLDVGVDLDGQSTDYYLEKARDNVPKYERLHRQEAEEALPGKLVTNDSEAGESESLGWSILLWCVVLSVGQTLLFWLLKEIGMRLWKAFDG